MWGRARREARLDPVRWRRPGRSTLLRSAFVAALMMTAALVLWTRPDSCAPPCPSGPGPATTPSRSGKDTAGLPLSASSGLPTAADRGDLAGLPTDAEQGDLAGLPMDAGQAPRRPAVPPGSIGVPIRLAEPTALKLVRPGDHVDVFRVPGTDGSPQAIATAALVLGVTGADDPSTGGLLLALTPAEARRTVTTPGGGYAVLIRPDG